MQDFRRAAFNASGMRNKPQCCYNVSPETQRRSGNERQGSREPRCLQHRGPTGPHLRWHLYRLHSLNHCLVVTASWGLREQPLYKELPDVVEAQVRGQ